MMQAQLIPQQIVGPSSCTLYHGDCLEVMKHIAVGSAAMVFADLPYAITHHAYDCPIDLPSFAKLAAAAYGPRGCLITTATFLFATQLCDAMKSTFRHDLVWKKSRPSGFLTAKKMPMRAHEHILVFAQKGFTYNPQMIDAGKPCDFRNDRDIGKPVMVAPSKIVYKKNVTNMRYPTSVIETLSVSNNNRLHPAQKPVSLLEWLIKTYTNEGDTVLDPVMGSGTTGVACARLGRHFIGIEKDQNYYQVASERIKSERLALGLT